MFYIAAQSSPAPLRLSSNLLTSTPCTGFLLFPVSLPHDHITLPGDSNKPLSQGLLLRRLVKLLITLDVWMRMLNSKERNGSQLVHRPLAHAAASTVHLDYLRARAQPTVLAQEKALLGCPHHHAICHPIHLLSSRNTRPRQLKWCTGLRIG